MEPCSTSTIRRTFHVAMTIHRSTRRGPFTSTELEASQELLPHLRRAMQLRLLLERSRAQEKLALEALDQLAAGMVIVDSQARVLFANMAAQEIAAAGNVLVLRDGTVRPRQREQCDVFRRLIGSAIAGEAGGSLLLSSSSRRLPVSCSSRPLSARSRSPSPPKAGLAPLQFSCPTRNAKLPLRRNICGRCTSSALWRCASPGWSCGQEASGAPPKPWDSSPETVRTHLKHIYAKTGVNRQSALALFAGSRNSPSSFVGGIPCSGDAEAFQRCGVKAHRDTAVVAGTLP